MAKAKSKKKEHAPQLTKVDSVFTAQACERALEYSTHIRWSKEDELFVATSPAFPFLTGVGDSLAAAAGALNTAVIGALEVLITQGADLPATDHEVAQKRPTTTQESLLLDAMAASIDRKFLSVLGVAGEDERKKDEQEFEAWFAEQKYSMGALPNWTQVAEMKRTWCIARETLRHR